MLWKLFEELVKVVLAFCAMALMTYLLIGLVQIVMTSYPTEIALSIVVAGGLIAVSAASRIIHWLMN